MAYKLVIADDEKSIREGLANFIKWEELGFEVVAKFQDGSEVISFLDTAEVDVVLSDIRMNITSGLEVAKYIYENKPNIKVVFISGYKEFELAKQALKYNVVNYLSKPIEIEDINNIFLDLKSSLNKQHLEKEMYDKKMKRYDEVVPLLEEKFFIDLIAGALKTRDDIVKRAYQIGLNVDIEKSKCCILTVNISPDSKVLYYEEDIYRLLKNYLQNAYKDILLYRLKSTRGNIHLFVIHNSNDDKNNIEFSINMVCENIKMNIKKLKGIEIEIQKSKIFDNIFVFLDDKFDIEHEVHYKKLNFNDSLTRDKEEEINNNEINRDEPIDKAKKYIDKHYMEDINLEGLADYVYLSSVYFSRIFKQKTGENFIDYLTKIRMEKAIMMLKEPQNRIYEISTKVGYKTTKYFYKLFKEYTGYTPTEYRFRLFNQENK
jgi:two-component system, response regulator YesN